MRFPIDVVFLDRWGWPIKVTGDVVSQRLVGRRSAAAVIELPAGEADRHFVVVE
jgi:hypothetical protein